MFLGLRSWGENGFRAGPSIAQTRRQNKSIESASALLETDDCSSTSSVRSGLFIDQSQECSDGATEKGINGLGVQSGCRLAAASLLWSTVIFTPACTASVRVNSAAIVNPTWPILNVTQASWKKLGIGSYGSPEPRSDAPFSIVLSTNTGPLCYSRASIMDLKSIVTMRAWLRRSKPRRPWCHCDPTCFRST